MVTKVETPKQMAAKIVALKKEITLLKRAKEVSQKALSATNKANRALVGPKRKKPKKKSSPKKKSVKKSVPKRRVSKKK